MLNGKVFIKQMNEGMFPCEHLVRVLSKYQKKFNKKLNVLELGCGSSSNLSLYNEYCKNFIGIDNSESAISKIKKNSQKFNQCDFKFKS